MQGETWSFRRNEWGISSEISNFLPEEHNKIKVVGSNKLVELRQNRLLSFKSIFSICQFILRISVGNSVYKYIGIADPISILSVYLSLDGRWVFYQRKNVFYIWYIFYILLIKYKTRRCWDSLTRKRKGELESSFSCVPFASPSPPAVFLRRGLRALRPAKFSPEIFARAESQRNAQILFGNDSYLLNVFGGDFYAKARRN